MSERARVVLFTEVNSHLGSPFLRVLSAHPSIDLVAVVTSPPGVLCSYFVDEPVPVDVEAEARGLGIPVMRPERVKTDAVVEALQALAPDYIIVANFQQILDDRILSVPRVAPINFHPGPLPRYAGLAPFYWIVRNGDRRTAISAILMDEGLDTGPIVMQREIALSGAETGRGLRIIQEQQNVLMLLDLIPALTRGSFTTVPQDLAKRSYYSRPSEEDYRLDTGLDAVTLERHVRAAYRHPGAAVALPSGRWLTVLSAAVGGRHDMAPPSTPGRLVRAAEDLFVAATDEWLQILTIEADGEEVEARASALREPIDDAVRLPIPARLSPVGPERPTAHSLPHL